MTATVPRRISPMGFGNPGVFVRRAYREGKPFQWLREADVNGKEAKATKVLFDVDMASYEALGVIRMQIEDDGTGIDPDKIQDFLNTFGGGGKPIGDEHDNFGVGFKSAALPWNGDGIVIRSLYNGEISISVLVFDQTTGEIGLEHLPQADQDDVDPTTPHDTTLVFDVDADWKAGETWIWRDIDWLGSFPAWVVAAGHGTVFTFLGTAANPDTFFGDPEVEEERSGRWAYLWYADRRFWTLNHELRIGGADSLDRKRIVAALDKRLKRPGVPAKTKHWELRRVRGLHDCIYMVPKKAGHPEDIDDIEDESAVTSKGWIKKASFAIGADNLPATCNVYYKDLPAHINPSTDIGWDPARYGLITALYKDECYDSERGHRHRSFGIPYPDIYNMVWIVIEPTLAGTDDSGVYPGTSRSHLHWKGAGTRAKELPWQEWADEFLARMEIEVPFLYEAIRNFVAATRSGDDVSKSLLKRTADKFLGRFKPLPKPPRYSPTKRPTRRVGALKKVENGRIDEEGENPGSSGGVRVKGKRRRTPSPGPNPGKKPGTQVGNASGTKSLAPHAKGSLYLLKQAQDDDDLPRFVWVDFNVTIPDQLKEPGLADLGVIYIDATSEVHCHSGHQVIKEVIEYWVKDYGEVHRAVIVDAVQDVYGTAVSTAVGHIMRQRLDTDTLRHRLEDLTSKFYGLYDVHELIGQRIRSTLGRGARKSVGTTP